MAVTAEFFGLGVSHIANAAIDWDTDTIKVLLTTSSYTPDKDAHNFRDDVTDEVANGNGYTTGGATLANKARSYDTATNEVRLDADDPSWTGASFTARRAVFYKSRGGASSADELIGWIDFGGNEQVTSGTFTIQFDSTGAFKFVVA